MKKMRADTEKLDVYQNIFKLCLSVDEKLEKMSKEEQDYAMKILKGEC